MANIIILEGSRMQWKSTIAQGLRQSTEGSTLINFTGFKLDGPEGLEKVKNYYQAFLEMFIHLPEDALIICDRIFISEMVYSRLYKSYDFTTDFKKFLNLLAHPFHKVRIYHLTASYQALAERLGRDKIPLFGEIDDNLDELVKQRNMYAKVMTDVDTYIEEFGGYDMVTTCIDTSTAVSSKAIQNIILKDIKST